MALHSLSAENKETNTTDTIYLTDSFCELFEALLKTLDTLYLCLFDVSMLYLKFETTNVSLSSILNLLLWFSPNPEENMYYTLTA